MTLKHRILPAKRRGLLKKMIQQQNGVRIIEAHNGLSGVIGATATAQDDQGNSISFDGLWISSLTDSAAKAHPDTEVIDASSRLQTIQEILQVTDKPIIVDGDTGGQPTQFEYFCSKLESLGVSAVVIEDKQWPKRNSLEANATHILEDPHAFAQKVNRAKEVCLSDDFMIFTRIESFIAKRGLEDALARASVYLDSKADGILIHSNQKTPDEIYSFMEAYKKLCEEKGVHKPVICVPTTYNHIDDETLFDHGINTVIYANHQLRAAHRAMTDACESILMHKRSKEITEEISPVKEIMKVTGFYDVKDDRFAKNVMPAVLLAAGKPKGFEGTDLETLAISAIPVDGKPLIQRQLSTMKSAGLTDVSVVTGYARETLPENSARECYNEDFAGSSSLHSLMMAARHVDSGFLAIFGDIYFNKHILRYLLKAEGDIVLLADNSFNLKTRQSIKSTTDMLCLEDSSLRKPSLVTESVSRIGNHIPTTEATHEFIGIAKFSAKGAAALNQYYQQQEQAAIDKEGDADAVLNLDLNAALQGLIDQGISVNALEITQGWSEVHNLTDLAALEKLLHRGQQLRTSTATL